MFPFNFNRTACTGKGFQLQGSHLLCFFHLWFRVRKPAERTRILWGSHLFTWLPAPGKIRANPGWSVWVDSWTVTVWKGEWTGLMLSEEAIGLKPKAQGVFGEDWISVRLDGRNHHIPPGSQRHQIDQSRRWLQQLLHFHVFYYL